MFFVLFSLISFLFQMLNKTWYESQQKQAGGMPGGMGGMPGGMGGMPGGMGGMGGMSPFE